MDCAENENDKTEVSTMKKAISLVVLLALSLSLAVGAAADHIVYWSMWESTEAQGQVIQKAIDQFVADTDVYKRQLWLGTWLYRCCG